MSILEYTALELAGQIKKKEISCREAVEAHGGEIWVERTGPEGTVFAFTVLKEGEQ